ncbi:protein LURP-one-related 7 isoform X2 [Silene latifolia]|uniref:protein LURP-one-related 7 isoform X2 n=1 Tax=Silene latifolia TaxID=37657 RepID=UPI003D779E2D
MDTMMHSTSSVEEKETDVIVSEDEIGIGIPQIPFDLFVKKTRKSIRFTDAFQNLVYQSTASQHQHHGNRRHVLHDVSGNTLLSLFRSHDGSWKGLKGDGLREELLFKVERTLNTFSKAEFNVILTGDSTFTMRGCCFWRTCTIYKEDKSLVAQTNLMYTLGFRKHFVSRSKFRVTIFPGFADYTLVAGLILVLFEGRK